MSKVILEGPEKCLDCGVSFKAEKIPKNSKEFYGELTHFSKLIGVYDVDLDRTVFFKCPECPARYGRDYKLITGKKQNEKKQRAK